MEALHVHVSLKVNGTTHKHDYTMHAPRATG